MAKPIMATLNMTKLIEEFEKDAEKPYKPPKYIVPNWFMDYLEEKTQGKKSGMINKKQIR